MPFDCAVLLAPVSGDKLCGEALDEHALYDDFRKLASSPSRPDWGRQLDRAMALSGASRDLRAWIWLTRASLCVDGVPGLAAGLRLMADGLDRYWEELPPQHADEPDPSERFMRRLSALTELGVTNYQCNLDQLQGHGRNLADLRADLDLMVAKAVPDAATRAAIDDARGAIDAMVRLFAERFGPGRDPQLGFEVVLDKLKAIEPKFRDAPAAAGGMADRRAPASVPGAAPAHRPGGDARRRRARPRPRARILQEQRAFEPGAAARPAGEAAGAHVVLRRDEGVGAGRPEGASGCERAHRREEVTGRKSGRTAG